MTPKPKTFFYRAGEELPPEDEALYLRSEEQLKPHRAEVSPAWRKVVMSRYFPRDCFPRAVQFMTLSPHLPQALYVLGEAACGGIGQHGWVEIDDVVFDGVYQEFYRRDAYYQSEYARVWYRFTRPATLWLHRMCRRQGQWTWRWDLELGLPWADFDNPMLLDLEMAKRYWYGKRAGRK